MRTKKIHYFAVLVGLLGFWGAVGAELDVYEVRDEVQLAAVPRFSMNVEQPPFAPWTTDQRINAWNLFYNLEPMVEQFYGQLDDGGADWAEHTTRPGFSHWDSVHSGYWDGAEMRVYRLSDGVMSHVRTSRIVSSSFEPRDPETRELGHQTVQLSEAGPPLQRGDLYVLTIKRDAPSLDIRPELLGASGIARLDRSGEFEGNLTWRFDREHPSPGGGRSSLRMEITEASPEAPAGPWHWFLVNNDDEPHIHLRFRPGKSYRFSVWLKQREMDDPRVRIQMGAFRTEIVEVGPEWKEYVFDLPLEDPAVQLPRRQNMDSRIFIGAYSSGTLWMDRMLVWQTDVEPFAMLPEYVERLREFRPHTLRLWGGYISPTLEYWLGEGHAQLAAGEMGRSGRPVVLPLHRSLQLCVEVGADPWFHLNPLFSLEEHKQLMEYLAGPADSPMGQVRKELGREAPWTEAFEIIYLESANETWNRIMRYEWHGRPEFYAAIADRQFRELKASAYYEPEQFSFILNGWDSQMGAGEWTPRVMRASREGERIDLAGYFGGWEEGAVPVQTGEGEVAEEIQDKLLATPVLYGRKLAQALSIPAEADAELFAMLQAYPQRWSWLAELLPSERPHWDESLLTPPAADSTGDRIRGLWARDVERDAAIRAAIIHRRAALERGFWSLAFEAMGAHPRLQNLAARRLNTPPGFPLTELCEGLRSHHAPAVLLPLAKQHPDWVAGWAEREELSERVRAELRQFAESPERLSYPITNLWRRALEEAVFKAAAENENPVLEAELRERVTVASLRPWVGPLERSGQTLMREAGERQARQLLAAMRRDPDFAREVFAWLTAHPQWLSREADAVSRALIREMEAQVLRNPQENPYHPLLTRRLTEPTADLLLARLAESVQAFDGDLGTDGRLIIPPLLAAARGNGRKLSTLPENEGYLSRMGALFRESLTRPIWQLAEDDAQVSEWLTRAGLVPRADRGIGLAVYEGGPGYSLPGPGRAPPEADEDLGKSLALGTATLDLYLNFLALDARPLAYYKFRSGAYWSTHNDAIEGIPYPSWLSLQLFNREVGGDMLTVLPRQVQRVDVPEKEIRVTSNDGRGRLRRLAGRRGVSWTSTYAFRDGERYAVVLLNRDASNARTVELVFPFEDSRPARMVVMTHPDPAAHNRFEAKVVLRETEAPDMRSGTRIRIPPASVMVWISGEEQP